MSEAFETGVVVAMEKVAAGKIWRTWQAMKPGLVQAVDKGVKSSPTAMKLLGAAKKSEAVVSTARRKAGERVGSAIAGRPVRTSATQRRLEQEAAQRAAAFNAKLKGSGKSAAEKMRAAMAKAKKAKR